MDRGFCNGFVVLPPLTGNGSVIFGKNSDRPAGEVQELVYEPGREHTAGEPLKCTYTEVKQVDRTYAVILSKPGWMWGAEMGANDQGVAIGNTLALCHVPEGAEKTLLGTDLVRLALERSKSSGEAVDVIGHLLEEHGQTTHYSDASSVQVHQNSFLIADATEAWVVESVGRHWVAERITSGYRNISGSLSIETGFEKSSADVSTYAKDQGLWNGEGDFNFAAAYSKNDFKSCPKALAGRELLQKLTESNQFNVKDMFGILRDVDGGICNGSETAGSQVSVLSTKRPCCHWFTATPDPTISVFKPFVFTPDVKFSAYTKSSGDGDRSHVLYSLHAAATSQSNNRVTSVLQDMERNCLDEVEKFLDDYADGQALSEMDELLKDVVETEVKFYK